MNGQIKSHKLGEVGIIVAKHACEVSRPILVDIDGANARALAIQISVNDGGNSRQLSNQVHGVLVHVLPVVGLVDALRVGLGELALALKRVDGRAELGHRVQVMREVVQHLDNMLRDMSAVVPFLGQPVNLLLGWNMAGQQEPEKTLWQWLDAAGCLW